MLKYSLRYAWRVFKSDGLIILVQETLRYMALYATPDKIIKYWLLRLFNVGRIVRNVQGSLMLLNLKDRGIQTDLFMHGIREVQATKHLRSIMQPDWTMVEIGANIGYYALMEARAVKRVIAIEPGPDNYKGLMTNIALNGYRNIETHQLAIGDHKGVVGFEISKACNWNKIARPNVTGDVQVQMTTLDDFLQGRKIDFLRMDVEGYELCILKGMPQTIRDSRPGMFIEVHRDLLRDYGGSQKELMEYLASFGYYVSRSYPTGKEVPIGRIDKLLADPLTAKWLTEKSVGGHLFFKGNDDSH